MAGHARDPDNRLSARQLDPVAADAADALARSPSLAQDAPGPDRGLSSMLTVWGRKTSSNVQALMWCIGELGLQTFRIERSLLPHRHVDGVHSAHLLQRAHDLDGHIRGHVNGCTVERASEYRHRVDVFCAAPTQFLLEVRAVGGARPECESLRAPRSRPLQRMIDHLRGAGG